MALESEGRDHAYSSWLGRIRNVEWVVLKCVFFLPCGTQTSVSEIFYQNKQEYLFVLVYIHVHVKLHTELTWLSGYRLKQHGIPLEDLGTEVS